MTFSIIPVSFGSDYAKLLTFIHTLINLLIYVINSFIFNIVFTYNNEILATACHANIL